MGRYLFTIVLIDNHSMLIFYAMVISCFYSSHYQDLMYLFSVTFNSSFLGFWPSSEWGLMWLEGHMVDYVLESKEMRKCVEDQVYSVHLGYLLMLTLFRHFLQPFSLEFGPAASGIEPYIQKSIDNPFVWLLEGRGDARKRVDEQVISLLTHVILAKLTRHFSSPFSRR
jgi:hypothetical protein